jgi:regulator of protease activity HflC (stomatin/prohibitin superfamily)
MAEIRSYGTLRHLRAEPSHHILRYRAGELVDSRSGTTFWFFPLSTALAEVPLDNREQPFLISGRTLDFQEAAVQGTLTFRVADPERLARRLDFSIDLRTGRHLNQPLDQMADLMIKFAQTYALEYLSQAPLRQALQEGLAEVRQRIEDGLKGNSELESMGIELVTVQLSKLSPSAEMEKALQAPTRESIQQQADQAAFERGGLAVEKERAIAENELQNKIELARREQNLIEQHGLNERRRATDEVETRRIENVAAAERLKVRRKAEAEGLRLTGAARNDAERDRMDIYQEVPAQVLLGLAARQLAGKLERIDHLSLTPDSLTPLLTGLMTATRKKLEAED